MCLQSSSSHLAADLQGAGQEGQPHNLRRIEGFLPWCKSPADAVRDAEVVFTSLPGPAEVEAMAEKISEAVLVELTEAMNRSWAERDSRVATTPQEDRAGVKVRVPAEALRDALKE